MRIYFYIIITLFLMLSGCCGDQMPYATVPKISRYTQDDNLIAADQRVAIGKKLEQEWWTLFANKDLSRVIKQAIKHNYTVAASRESLAQAEQAVKALRGSLWPQINVVANAGRQKYGVALFGPVGLKIPPFTYYELGPELSWNIDIFGQTRNAIKQQEALREYQRYNLDAAYIDLTSSVVSQALEIATVKAEIAATLQIIREDEKTLELVQQAFRANTHSKTDILSAQTQLENDRATLPPLQQRLSVAKHALAILVGKTPVDWNVPEFDLDAFTLPHELPVRIPSELAHKRPDILAAEANLQAACAALGVANANFYPTLIITANTLQEALTPGGLFKAVNNAFAIVANLTQPIFQGGTLVAQRKQAEHAYKQMLAQYQQTILTSFQEVADTLTALSHDADTIIAQQQALTATKESLQLSYASYKAGTLGLLQIQSNQRALARAQLNLIQAQGQRFLDTAQLFVVLGGSPIQLGADSMLDADSET